VLVISVVVVSVMTRVDELSSALCSDVVVATGKKLVGKLVGMYGCVVLLKGSTSTLELADAESAVRAISALYPSVPFGT
jgi:hypothetical protein